VRRPGRSWRQRLLITFNCLLVLACLSSAAGLAYVRRQVSDVPRLSMASVLDVGEAAAGEPRNILMVGVDDDAGLDADDPVTQGRSTSLNTDTIMVLRLDPSSESASLLSLPRDLWVPIAGSASKGRINSALALGGPERLIATIQENFDIPIHNYVQVNFAGFRSLVEEIDGVPVYLPWLARDVRTGFANEEIGCVTLDPVQALAFARSRYFEIDEGNGWVADPLADLSRVGRQQKFIQAAMKRAIAQGVRNPFVLNGLISVAQQHVTLDDQLTTQDMVDLGMEFRDFNPDELDVYTPPGTHGMAGAASVMFLDEVAAQPIFDIFRGTTPADGALPTVRVEVRNGTGRSGEGAEASAALTEHGFAAVRAVDARSFQVTATEVRYAPGQEAAALELARHLPTTPVLVEDETVPADVSVVLVTGSDWTGLAAEPMAVEDLDTDLTTTTTTVTEVEEVPDDDGEWQAPTADENRFVPQVPPGESCG
jgi:LCP family protein required for cell wall assembly